ncbi:hypothetical protein [Paludibacterium sp. B53371]|uniref:hypothetical protein n=1 Tax=Paludibacterium sp. B53371 TaxID=2806263 RepID=UPI001C05B8C6|nr:hypothetical protein [Paludibacterium sp. B53371]
MSQTSPSILASLAESFKYGSAVLSLIALLSWMAGHAFALGFWASAGLPEPPFDQSPQVVTLNGFLFAAHNWLLLLGAMVCLCVGWYLKGLVRLCLPSVSVRLKSWLCRWFLPGPAVRRLSGWLLLLAGGVMLPLTVWLGAALEQGKARFQQLSASVNDGSPLPTRVALADGGVLEGQILGQDERLLVLLSACGVTLLQLPAPARVMAHNRTSHRDCPLPPL